MDFPLRRGNQEEDGVRTAVISHPGHAMNLFEEHPMDLQLNDRRALITGSTGGIGYAIAQGLAAEGAQVIITGRTQTSVDAALARLTKAVPNAKAAGIAADCASAAGAEM